MQTKNVSNYMRATSHGIRPMLLHGTFVSWLRKQAPIHVERIAIISVLVGRAFGVGAETFVLGATSKRKLIGSPVVAW